MGQNASAVQHSATFHLLSEPSWCDKPGLEFPPGVSPHLLRKCGPGCTQKHKTPGPDPSTPKFESEEDRTSTPWWWHSNHSNCNHSVKTARFCGRAANPRPQLASEGEGCLNPARLLHLQTVWGWGSPGSSWADPCDWEYVVTMSGHLLPDYSLILEPVLKTKCLFLKTKKTSIQSLHICLLL